MVAGLLEKKGELRRGNSGGDGGVVVGLCCDDENKKGGEKCRIEVSRGCFRRGGAVEMVVW